MNDSETRMRDALERIVPLRNDQGDWERVRTDAESRTRRTWAARAAVALAAAALAVAALAWPFESEPPTAIERALAAMGDGPVLHLVLRGDWGPTIVDLESGRRTRVPGETEVWFDDERGLHEITLLGGKHEVGVDRKTFKAVYFRTTRDRKPPPGRGGGTTVEKLERLPAGSGDFRPLKPGASPSAPFAPRVGLALGFGWDGEIELEAADAELGGRLLWLGDSFGEKPLATVRRLMLQNRRPGETGWNRTPGVALFYGELAAKGQPDHRKPRVIIEEARALSPAWRGVPGQAPAEVPDGNVVVLATGEGFLHVDGVYVSIPASNEAEMLDGARALRPLD